MDALIAPPTSSVKKKRRPSASGSSKDSTTVNSSEPSAQTSPKGSPPKAFSFYKDMIDEKVDQRSNDSDSNQNDDNNDDDCEVFEVNTNSEGKASEDSVSRDVDEESTHMNVDIVVPDISVNPSVSLTAPMAVISNRSSQKIKPILCYIKKGAKKSVRSVSEVNKPANIFGNIRFQNDLICSLISNVIKSEFYLRFDSTFRRNVSNSVVLTYFGFYDKYSELSIRFHFSLLSDNFGDISLWTNPSKT